MDALPLKYICSVCKTERTYLPKLFSHMKILHWPHPGFHVNCPVPQCACTFKNIESFKKHLYRKHPLHLKDNARSDVVANLVSSAPEISVDDFTFDGSDDNSLQNEEVSDEDALDIDKLRKNVALLLLKIREQHQLPSSVAQNIANDLSGILESCLEVRRETIIENPHFATSVTSIIKSEHVLNAYCKKSLNLVEPEEFVLGVRKIKKRVVKDTTAMVPIGKVIKMLLNHDDIWQDIMEDKARLNKEKVSNSESDVLNDFTDGEIFKRKNFLYYPTKDVMLRIQLYLDEVELCNPLGGKRGLNKITLFYFTIGNVKAYRRSKLLALRFQIHACLKVRL